MIERIVLKNVTSYSPLDAVSIAPLKRVNLLYGLNGTGKSTIGKFLQAMGNIEFKYCQVYPEVDPKSIFVYNQVFVEKNFQQDTHPGIFTLNQGNIEAEAAIRADQDSYNSKIKAREKIIEDGVALKDSKDQEGNKLKEALWAIKKNHDEGSLKYCLEGFHSDKNKLKEYLLKAELSQVKTRPFKELEEKAAELLSSDSKLLDNLSPISFSGGNIENEVIFQEVISASTDSYLSELIQKLGNSDWVKISLPFVVKANGKCPLCQGELPHDFEAHIRRLFDETYNQKIEYLRNIKYRYETSGKALIDRLEGEPFKSSLIQLDSEFVEQKSALIRALADNAREIDVKINAATKKIKLTPTEGIVQRLNEIINREQQRVQNHNAAINNKSSLLEDIRTEFWIGLRKRADEVIVKHNETVKRLNDAMDAKRAEVRQLDKELADLMESISNHRLKITNIETSIDNINKAMVSIGLAGFSIKKEPGDATSYRLVRPEGSSNVFKSLSEGEKTIITFLYFIELCLGSVQANAPAILSDRIVVIDDPISSLSHNYVYEISSLIYHKIIHSKNNFKQIFVLTHNLFFFHEMLKNAPRGEVGKYQCFRITKGDYSDVAIMGRDDVQNNYQAYWQVIKDARSGKASATVLPNIMRNILEHYFGFILKQDDLLAALSKLEEEDAEFKPLYRYINRGSHADSINITDFGGVDSKVIIEKFKLVFMRSGFPEHYNKMMGEDTPV